MFMFEILNCSTHVRWSVCGSMYVGECKSIR